MSPRWRNNSLDFEASKINFVQMSRIITKTVLAQFMSFKISFDHFGVQKLIYSDF